MQHGYNQVGPHAAGPTKAGWRISEWTADTGLSRSLTYNLLKSGLIQAVKVGKVRVITTSPAEFLAGYRAEVA
jgi:hypothetical protein